MPQSLAQELGRIPMTPVLVATLARAGEYAAAQGHRSVTVEHLLLALSEDEEAAGVLSACNVDHQSLRNDVSGFLGQLGERAPPGEAIVPTSSPELMRVIEYAAAAAQQGRRARVDGAITLAALIGEGRSMAASFLRSHGLTFEAVVRILQEQTRAQQAAPIQNGAAPPSADEILATARDRIELSRNQGRRAPPHQQPVETEQPAHDTVVASAPISPRIERSQDDSIGPLREQSRDSDAPIDLPPYDPGNAERTAADGSPPPLPSRRPPEEAADRQASRATAQGPTTTLQDDANELQQRHVTGRDSLPPWATRQPERARQPKSATMPWQETPHGAPEQGDRVPGAPSRPRSEASPPAARQPTSLRDRLKPSPSPAIEAGQLVENVPRQMRVGRAEVVEIRIAREHAAGTMVGLQGHGPPVRHDLYITKAMSVRLRAPDGGFRIEAASPETQWTEPAMGSLSGEFASWRFMVTPERRGEHMLQLVVAARVIGSDGLTAETTLPDQVITVHVRANYVRGVARWSGWLAALVIGGLIGKLSEDGFASLLQLLHRQFGG